MSGWRNWPHFDSPYETSTERRSLDSYWLPEPLSLASVPQPHRRAVPTPPTGLPRRARISPLAVPGTPAETRDSDVRWFIPAVVFVVVCVAVKWWSDRR